MVFFGRRLELLERLADNRQTHRCRPFCSVKTLTVLAQQRIIVLDYELTRYLEERCLHRDAAARRGCTAWALSTAASSRAWQRQMDTVQDDLEAAGDLDLRDGRPAHGNQNTLHAVRE